MKKVELIKLKKLLKSEINRKNRINELLSNNLIQEFLSLNKLDINCLTKDEWIILEELLKEFKITESNGILVCTGSYVTACRICYQETDYYTRKVSFDSEYIEYQMFEDIETSKIHTAYCDIYVQRAKEEDRYSYEKDMTLSEFCHKRYGMYLVSELKERYTILNPYNSLENENGFKDVQRDFFTTAIEKGQPKAKQLVLAKYSHMK